jgi:tetratricopeptide (TPR) repeat protein
MMLLFFCFAVALIAQQKALKTFLSEAQTLQGEGKLQEAVDLLKEAVSVYPNVSDAHLQLGLAWGALGQKSSQTGDMMTAMTAVNEGFAAFERAIELDPKNIDAHLYYGAYGVNVPTFFGKLNPGVEHLEKALSLTQEKKQEDSKDRLTALYRFLGKGYQMQEKLKDAEVAYQKVLDISSEGENADAARAGLESLKQTPTSAVPKIQKKALESSKIAGLKAKIEKSPNDFELQYALGKAYFDERNWGEAQNALRKAVALNKNHFDAQFLLTRALMEDATVGYDERIYEDQTVRTNLAFEVTRQLERALEIDPSNVEARLWYAVGCVQMPFFVQKIDEGLARLDDMAKDASLPDSVRAEALFQLGFGYRKKGHALWMKLLKEYPKSRQIQGIYDEFGLREYVNEGSAASNGTVSVTFHLGFQDEVQPQTAVWVEDANGKFVKTLYVSGFSAYAKEKQVNLPRWSGNSKFETDGTTGASIDWGKHTYSWNLTGHDGKRVKDGMYKVFVEVAWWPSMEYGRASADIRVGPVSDEATVKKGPHIPLLKVQYTK